MTRSLEPLGEPEVEPEVEPEEEDRFSWTR